MIKKAFRILKATFGVVTNREELIPKLYFSAEYESLLTDFHKVEEIKYGETLDFYIVMLDEPETPFDISIVGNRINLTGSVLKATEETSDLRYTIFGNEGLLFRYVLMFLEQKYNIYSFHACALYDEKANHMYIGPGGAGSGKTCLILKGLELGLKLFSTEMTHFSFEDGLTLYKGSLVDNVRIGNLKYSYPAVTKKLNLKLPEAADEWGKKIAIDLTKLETKFDSIKKTDITVILPHIEEGRDENIVVDVKNARTARKALFDNISDKIANNVLLYETTPIMGFDNPALMRNRFCAVDKFLKCSSRVVKEIGGSQNCWDGIIRK
jgi:hypothetical protein